MDLSQGNTTDSLFRQSTGFCRLSFFCSILLPYIPFSMRQPLLLFTKFLELKECMSAPPKRFDFGQGQAADFSDAVSDLFTKLSPLLSEQERAQFSQMQNMMQMLKLYQTFQELAPLMNMGGDSAPTPENAFAWMDMAKNAASAMKEMPAGFFEAAKNISHATSNNAFPSQFTDSGLSNVDGFSVEHPAGQSDGSSSGQDNASNSSDWNNTNSSSSQDNSGNSSDWDNASNLSGQDNAGNSSDWNNTSSSSSQDNSGNSSSPGSFSGSSFTNASDGGMSDMLLSMLSPEQKEMFENLKSVMSDTPTE